MSWRGAAELARQWAADSRRLADHLVTSSPLDQERLRVFDQDRPALTAWLKRRVAQEMDRFANECQKRSSMEDITVTGPAPGTKR